MAVRRRVRQIGRRVKQGSRGLGLPVTNEFVVVGKAPKFRKPFPKKIAEVGSIGETVDIEEGPTVHAYEDRRRRKGTIAGRKK